MPIPPPPLTFHCPICGWCRTVIPRSDALLPGIDWFERCPQCASQPLQQRPATAADILKAKLQHLFDIRP